MASRSVSADAGTAKNTALIAKATTDTTPKLRINLKTPDPRHLIAASGIGLTFWRPARNGYISSIHHSSTKTLNFHHCCRFSPCIFGQTMSRTSLYTNFRGKGCECGNTPLYTATQQQKASWRNGYAEDCKSLHPSSILGEASSSCFPDFMQSIRISVQATEIACGSPVPILLRRAV
jgi:hypothetical protein